MDLIETLRSYVDSVLKSVHDMKVVLFDEDTSHIVALLCSQSEILRQDVVLVEPLQKQIPKPIDEALSILQCVCIVRPTAQNIMALCRELNCPHYNTYYIFFTNAVKADALQQIAFADHSSKVFVVHEIYMDVMALNRRLFSLNMKGCIRELSLSENRDTLKMNRIVDGLFSLLCAFKLKPAIRYEGVSSICRMVGERLREQIDLNRDMLQVSNTPATILLLDRRMDPLIPLLHTWSYQGMMHELLDVQNNIIVTSQRKSFVVDERTDPFFAQHLFANYGDIGEAVQVLTDGMKSLQTDVSSINDVEALKKFIHNYPIYQEKQTLAAKHAGILSEISDRVKREKLIQFAPLEQKIATENDQSGQFNAVMEAIRDPEVTDENALRVALLYAIHYERNADSKIDEIKTAIQSRRPEFAESIDVYLRCVGQSCRRTVNLFDKRSLLSKARNLIGLEDNRFDLYTPVFAGILQKLEKKQLDAAQYPFLLEPPASNDSRKFIIFFVGGITYEEARLAYEASKSTDLDIIVGGTQIHRMKSFVNDEIKGSE